MKAGLSPWCKNAKIEMIKKEVDCKAIASEVGLTRQYVAAIVNGRVYSEQAIQIISDYLDIPAESYLCGNFV